MDVILTIRFKITAEVEITKHMFCVLRKQTKQQHQQQQQHFSKQKQTNNNQFVFQLFPKASFLAVGLLVGEFNGFNIPFTSFQNVSCQLRGIPISPRTC